MLSLFNMPLQRNVYKYSTQLEFSCLRSDVGEREAAKQEVVIEYCTNLMRCRKNVSGLSSIKKKPALQRTQMTLFAGFWGQPGS